MDFLRLSQVGAATCDHPAIFIMGVKAVAHASLHAIEFPGRQEFSVRQILDSVAVAADSRKDFHVTVPWSKILIADRPVRGKAVSSRALEFKIAPALCLASPHQGFPPCLIAANPVKRLFMDIRMFFVLHEEMLSALVKGVALTDNRVLFYDLLCQFSAVNELPRILEGGGIILIVHDVSSPFQHQGLQSVITEFLGRPAPGDTRANDNRVVTVLVSRLQVKRSGVWHRRTFYRI